MSATTRDSPLPSTLSPSAVAATRDAISPQRAPPMPSATANSGGWQTQASSLRRRLRPGCERPVLRPSALMRAPRRQRLPAGGAGLRRRLAPLRTRCSPGPYCEVKPDARAKPAHPRGGTASGASGALRPRARSDARGTRGHFPEYDSCLEPQIGAADPHEVARGKLARPAEPDAVDERAVGRSHVFDPDAVAPWLDAGVVRGSVVVPVEADVVRVATADRDARGIELELGVLVDCAAPDHDEPAHLRLRLGSEPGRGGLLRADYEAFLRHSEVAARCANDAPDEEVEEDEERSLQKEQGALDVDGGGDHAASELTGRPVLGRPLTLRTSGKRAQSSQP